MRVPRATLSLFSACTPPAKLGPFMDNHFSSVKLQAGELIGFSLLRHDLRLWWRLLPVGLYAAYWPGILSALTILGLLLAFHQVVQGAVTQGKLRGQATAMHVEATWRCNTLQDLQARGSCLLQLNAVAHGDTLLQTQNMAPEPYLPN